MVIIGKFIFIRGKLLIFYFLKIKNKKITQTILKILKYTNQQH